MILKFHWARYKDTSSLTMLALELPVDRKNMLFSLPGSVMNVTKEINYTIIIITDIHYYCGFSMKKLETLIQYDE